jgi:DNA-binding NarL/FixJ family response regulator
VSASKRPLAPREQAILVLIGQGLSDEEIARTLRIELDDVRYIVASITRFVLARDRQVDLEGLTQQERQVRALLERGFTRAQAAAELGMGKRQVQYVSDRIRAKLGIGSGQWRPGRGMPPRQQEVAALIAEGLTDRQIAERLRISPRTVESHASAVLKRLGVKGRTEVREVVNKRPVSDPE